jgi:HD-GYP domain-containing protein (c-di-GMP phosphodiesterase class II)
MNYQKIIRRPDENVFGKSQKEDFQNRAASQEKKQDSVKKEEIKKKSHITKQVRYYFIIQNLFEKNIIILYICSHSKTVHNFHFSTNC